MIEQVEQDSAPFRAAALRFLKHAQETINPAIGAADVREMLIQHILTEEIFSKVFDESDFHRQNNVAKELYALEASFFTGGLKRRTLAGLGPYYAAIRAAAAQIAGHGEKQAFLKVIYENFYKVYNPKAADRLGVVYTPNAIVRFMIESADWLCQQHFGKRLIDPGVEILDPATGTGTFITELIEHFRGQPGKLRQKYREELHANEVAILPYYVANLNIEATYAAITGKYEEFPNLCFVDTLDNVAGLATRTGAIDDLFGSVSEENVARLRRQNARRISVVIGNPPYNANQANENENNKNREYKEIDRRIKATYIRSSTAQKTKLYDMYARFFRWASDRLGDEGVLAFVTNRSFIERPTFDGFRTEVAREFSDILVVDLGGDVRGDPRLSGTRNNVFGIQTGIAISFLVRRAGNKGCRIQYARRPQLETAEEKLAFLERVRLDAIEFEEVRSRGGRSWVNQAENDFDTFLPLASKATKAARSAGQLRAIFHIYSLGINTARDQWLYDFEQSHLAEKVKSLLLGYEAARKSGIVDDSIKWSRNLKRRRDQDRSEEFADAKIVSALYRPFTKRILYQSPLLIDEVGRANEMFPIGQSNTAICFSDVGSRTNYCVLAVGGLADLHFGSSIDAYQQVARYRYAGTEAIDNITDWALRQFRAHYDAQDPAAAPVTKDAIFHYTYAALHDPLYRETYVANLKREFPRIPLHADFWRWAAWGEALMKLHVGYEAAEPWPLVRVDVPDERKPGATPKVLLRADPAAGVIQLDADTQLAGVPPAAWDYRLGSRTALGWVLDQHKERAPKDRVVRERFNTYRFADHRERVIDLLRRVTRVSVETVAITEAMRALDRGAGSAAGG